METSFMKNGPPIRSVSELTHALNQEEPSQYQHLIKRIHLEIKDVQHYCTWNQESYTRNLIQSNKNYQLLIMCWQKNQCSPIHSHGGRACFMYVIQGIIQEEIFHVAQDDIFHLCKDQTNTLQEFSDAYIDDSIGMHSIQCMSTQAISLHIYAKPIEQYSVFDSKENKLIPMKYSIN